MLCGCFPNIFAFPLLLFALNTFRAHVMMSRSSGESPGFVNRCHKLYWEISPDVNSDGNKKIIRIYYFIKKKSLEILS